MKRTMVSRPMTLQDYFRERLFEMFAAASMLGMALTLFTSPNSIAYSTFRLMTEHGLSQPLVMTFLFLFGSARAGALIWNGRSDHVGPWVRAIGAAAGAVWWAQCSITLYVATSGSVAGTSMGASMYALAAVADMIVVSLALNDVAGRKAVAGRQDAS